MIFLGAFRRLILYFEAKNGGRARPSSAHSCIATRCWPHSSHLSPSVQFFCTSSGRARGKSAGELKQLFEAPAAALERCTRQRTS